MNYRLGVVCLALVLMGCQSSEVTVVDVPKSVAARPTSTSAQNASRFHVKLPDHWAPVAPGPMRLAQYEIGNGDHQVVVTVTTLPGDAGGSVSNVNRWRGQLQLSPLSDAEMRQSIRREVRGKYTFDLASFVNPTTGKGVMGAIAIIGSDTWFVKATGPAGPLMNLRSQFDAFLASVEVTD
ncbi:hypothetical protein EB093_03940 [bacterium]|nr:hypothetical protein [bacterium]